VRLSLSVTSSRRPPSRRSAALTQAGVALVNTRVIVLETIADNAHPRANEIYAPLLTDLVIMDDGGD
jgi:hypothetical protein